MISLGKLLEKSLFEMGFSKADPANAAFLCEARVVYRYVKQATKVVWVFGALFRLCD